MKQELFFHKVNMNDLIAEASQLPYKELKQYFEDLDLKTLHQLKLDIDDQYEYGDVLLDDEQYDLLVDVIKERDPKSIGLPSRLQVCV